MKQLTVNQAMRIAIQHHQAGRLAEAEEIYHQVLSRQPDHPDALHLLGVAANQAGRLDAAIDLIRQAIALSPATAVYHDNLGNALRDQGLLDEAIAAYREAIRLNPSGPSAYNNLGNALREKGSIDEALTTCRAALRLKPDFAEAHNNLGSVLREKGLLGDAIAAYGEALRLKPNLIEARNNLGNALRDRGMFDEAISEYRRVLRVKPDLAETHNELGNALRKLGRLDEAVAAIERAIQIKPGLAVAHVNLATTLRGRGKLEESIAACRQALRLDPNYAEAHLALSWTLLLKGDFAQGWPEYEWRWGCSDFTAPARDFARPRWDGSPLNGQTILLHAEQGFGDAIQFARYVPMVASRGGKVVLECHPELIRWMRSLSGVEQFILLNQNLPHYDVHCPLLSLPLVFKTDLDSIPARVPYIAPNSQLISEWEKRLGPADGQLRIGLNWSGNPDFRADRSRSISLSHLADLAAIGGVAFYNLQKGRASNQAIAPPPGMRLIDLAPALNDFADTAAAMSHLDLIISTDTAVAHLAGALGRPVWVLLQYVPDWRWLLEREDSPWYPSMRLFRQPVLGDWKSVIQQVCRMLENFNRNEKSTP